MTLHSASDGLPVGRLGVRVAGRGTLLSFLGTTAAVLLLIPWPSGADDANTPIEEFWVPNGQVYSMVLSGSTLYIGGSFTTLGPRTGGGARIDAVTGSPDLTWPMVEGGDLLAVAPDRAGGFYIGGNFTKVGGVTRNRIAHILADGRVSAWDPNANGSVSALVLSGTTVYAGGSFTNIGGQPRNRIAALDATVNTNNATPWDPNSNGQVAALAVSGTTVYAGGPFTTIGGQTRNRIAALDATLYTNNATPWDPNSNSPV